MDWKLSLALAGWVLAITQFIFTYIETKNKNEAELLEKTLGYFERGMLARSIGISLVEGVWLKRKKKLHIILPVLISQATFLLTEAEDSVQEQRNLIRLLGLIRQCMPYANHYGHETAEISESLMEGSRSNKGVNVANHRVWFANFNNGDTSTFDLNTNA